MRGNDFEDEDTQPGPVSGSHAAGTKDGAGDPLYEIEWAEDEQAGGELVLRVTPITRAKASTP